jgi:hypothetical protein
MSSTNGSVSAMISAFPEVVEAALGVPATGGGGGGPVEDLPMPPALRRSCASSECGEHCARCRKNEVRALGERDSKGLTQINWKDVRPGKLYYIEGFASTTCVLARLDEIWFSKVCFDDQRICYTEISGRRHRANLSGPSPFFEYNGPDVKVATWEEYVAAIKAQGAARRA